MRSLSLASPVSFNDGDVVSRSRSLSATLRRGGDRPTDRVGSPLGCASVAFTSPLATQAVPSAVFTRYQVGEIAPIDKSSVPFLARAWTGALASGTSLRIAVGLCTSTPTFLETTVR